LRFVHFCRVYILVPIQEIHAHCLTVVICFCTLVLYPFVRFVFLLTLYKFVNVKEVCNTVISRPVLAHIYDRQL
jgi:hypothetical protein